MNARCCLSLTIACAASAFSPPIFAQQHGTIKGRVLFKGDPAPFEPKPITAMEGTHCTPGSVLGEDVLLSKSADAVTIGNVVVSLKEYPFEATPQPSTSLTVLDIVGCRFEPHVIAVQAQHRVDVRNSDPFAHHIKIDSQRRPYGFELPKKNMRLSILFDAERPMKVRSVGHPWMIAWLLVFEHPYFTVTDASGTFSFTDFPAGKYVLEAWHEKFGVQTLDVDLIPGQVRQVDFVFSPDAPAQNATPTAPG